MKVPFGSLKLHSNKALSTLQLNPLFRASQNRSAKTSESNRQFLCGPTSKKKVDSFIKKYLKQNGMMKQHLIQSWTCFTWTYKGVFWILSVSSLSWGKIPFSAEMEKTGLQSASVIKLVCQATALTENASHYTLVVCRKGLLAKVLSDSLDLIDGPS